MFVYLTRLLIKAICDSREKEKGKGGGGIRGKEEEEQGKKMMMQSQKDDDCRFKEARKSSVENKGHGDGLPC